MDYLRFWRTGHRTSCPAPSGGPCHCESFLYAVTGALSLFTGLIQVSYGYTKSLAITSDALHALVDSSTDFYGSAVAKQNQSTPEKSQGRTRRFNVMAGVLLIVGVAFLWWELGIRLFHGYGEVSVLVVSVLGGLGTLIDGSRLWLLTRAGRYFVSETRYGVILHVKSDLWHSLSVMLIGLFLLATIQVDKTFLVILPKFDALGTILIGILMLNYAYNLIMPKRGADHSHHHGDHHHE